MQIYLRAGKVFDINAQHVIDGFQYPVGFFRDPNARAAMEIELAQAPVDPPPDPRFYIITQHDNGTWDAIPRDPAQFVVPLCADIDAAADNAYIRIAGSAGRVAEYQRAYDEAAAFAADDYLGQPGQTVAGWATIKGWSMQQAADDILQARGGFDAALYGIRSIRLSAKEGVRVGTTAEAKHEAALAAIQQLNAITID